MQNNRASIHLHARKDSPNQKSCGSVDDFLAQYRHEGSSIETFLSCLEEPEPSQDQISSSIGIFSLLRLPDAESSAFSRRSPVTLADVPSHCQAKQASPAAASSKRTQRSSHPISESARTTFQSPTHRDSSAEERRRSKNREYQRRYREKRMLSDLRRQLYAACPPCAPSPRIQ